MFDLERPRYMDVLTHKIEVWCSSDEVQHKHLFSEHKTLGFQSYPADAMFALKGFKKATWCVFPTGNAIPSADPTRCFTVRGHAFIHRE